MPAETATRRDPTVLRWGRHAWALVGMAVILVIAWIVLSRLAVVTVPLVLALFPAAALAPAVAWLARHRLPHAVAALLVVLSLVVVLGGMIALTVPSFIAQLPTLADSVARSGSQLEPLLARIPGMPPDASVEDLLQRARESISGSADPRAAAGAFARVAGTVLTVLGALLLLLVALFFYLHRGSHMVDSTIALLPARRRDTARRAADQVWATLGAFVRAQFIVALIDAVLIGTGIALLGVPLALPLAVLIFLGAFLPYVGAISTGLLAVLVALADRGPGIALAVLVIVVVVQQVEGYLIEPMLTGRMVRLPAFVIIVAIAVGGTLLGVLGAFLAVPVTACATRLISTLRNPDQTPDQTSADEPVS